jgi:predicted RNA-binding Zn-ribbon protein involved in translation (DUF1610 family)
MSTAYRIKCEKCGVPDETGAKGLRVPAESRAYLADDERLVPLPSPIDAASLKEQGITWHRAAICGRVLRVRNIICPDCGAMNADVSTTYVTSAGCLMSLALAVMAYLLLHHVAGIERSLALIVGYALLILPSLTLSQYVAIRHRERTRRLGFNGCVKCGSKKRMTVSKARGRTLPCPACGEKTLKITFDR